jgi:hypothetical protein
VGLQVKVGISWGLILDLPSENMGIDCGLAYKRKNKKNHFNRNTGDIWGLNRNLPNKI